MTKAIRNQYAQLGVDNYYKTNANVYQNPHEEIITSLISQSLDRIDYGQSIYDLCCGNGLMTKLLRHKVQSITGIDPYMAKQYQQQTSKPCLKIDLPSRRSRD